tara:strand:- start:133 stop:447 length:315 start_codon:yes stop_codon:yes gene_type:complete
MSRIKKEVIESPFKDLIHRKDIFSDVMLGNLMRQHEIKRSLNRKKKYIHDTDKTIKACPKCNRCWERTRLTGNHRDKKTIYYDNFPKLGKEIKVCDNCQLQEEK